MMNQLKSKKVSIDGGVVSYLQIGIGKPFILLNGFTHSFRDWNREFIEKLSEDFELFMPNLVGIGESKSDSRHHSIERYAFDIFQMAKNLNLKEFAVFGHSIGGYVAQELALLCPKQIDFLVLSSTRMGGNFATMAPDWVIQSLVKEYASEEERRNTLVNLLCPARELEKVKKNLDEIAKFKGPDSYCPLETQANHNNARAYWIENFGSKNEAYRQFPFPTLIFSGSEDVIIPHINSVAMAGQIPNCWLVRVPNGGHALTHQYPKYLHSVILSFRLVKFLC